MQDPYGTDLTHESGPRSSRLYGSHPETRARSYRSGIFFSLQDLDHDAEIDDLPGV